MDVLIIDDERPVAEALQGLLGQEGFRCAFECEAQAGLERVPEARVVLLDLKLPGVEGFDLLEACRRENPRTPVVMVTAHGTVRTAVEAMRRGASDFIVKPPDRDDLLAAVRRALRTAESEESVSELCFDLPEDVVFRDGATRSVLERLRRAAASEITVLLEGETGVGKEVFARLVSRWSPRASAPFVKINCAAIPENLFESELFGHEKGAFTGASVAKPGRVELADGGTLFLDEVGELPMVAQAKLLQFLQDRTFERVGGIRTLRSDVRLVAATNRDLEACVKDGTFRSDLFFRLGGLRVRVPPLRERREDIPALARRFLERYAKPLDVDLSFAPGAIEGLLAHEWPGNVRELEHGIERAVAMAEGESVACEDILPSRSEARTVGEGESLRDQKRAFERARIREALDETGGNRTRAAETLGMSRRMLQKKLKEYDIE